jgi:hypothetical protein
MVEGRQVARITCRGCRRTAEIDPQALRGLRGPRLYRALVCSQCGARDADVSIRWEAPPAATPKPISHRQEAARGNKDSESENEFGSPGS